jgi:hypothetical protein
VGRSLVLSRVRLLFLCAPLHLPSPRLRLFPRLCLGCPRLGTRLLFALQLASRAQLFPLRLCPLLCRLPLCLGLVLRLPVAQNA